MKGLSLQDSAIRIERTLGIIAKKEFEVRYQEDESVRITMTLTKEQWNKLQHVKNLISHSVPSGSWAEIFEFLSDQIIHKNEKFLSKDLKKTHTKPSITSQANSATDTTALNSAHTEATASMSTRHISPDIRAAVWRRDERCQFKSPHNHKICGSRWQLQIDHIKPIWAGGTNELHNLRLLCGQHNRYYYQQQHPIFTSS